MKREVLYHTTKPYHAPRRGSAFASPSNGSAATSPASIIVRAYESWADDENQCFVVTSTFASKKGGNENSPFGASTKSVVVPARGTDRVKTPSQRPRQVQVQRRR